MMYIAEVGVLGNQISDHQPIFIRHKKNREVKAFSTIWGRTIGKLGYIDRTTPHLRWASKNPCTTPKREGRDFSDDPPRMGGSSGQCYLVLLLLYS